MSDDEIKMLKELLRRVAVLFIEYAVFMLPGALVTITAAKRSFFVTTLTLCHRGPFAMFLLSPQAMGWCNWPWLWWSSTLFTNVICILAYLIYPNKITGTISFFGIAGWFVFAFSFVMWLM